MTLFEKIIARQIPARVAYEDEQYIVIHDVEPQAPVHVLIIPKRVIPTLNDVRPEDAALVGGMFVVAAKVMAGLGRTDYRTVFNCGPGAQQTVFHLHLHCLAGRAFTWPPVCDGAITLNAMQLRLLFTGMDWTQLGTRIAPMPAE